MSLVQIISASEFIGASLEKINNNFSNIDNILVTLSSGVVDASGSVDSIFVSKEEYQRIDTTIRGTEDIIEQFLTPSLCDVRLSCSSTEHYTYTDIETDKVYLHPYNGNYISLYDTLNKNWRPYELLGVKEYQLLDSNSFTGTGLLTPNSLCAVFVYLENNLLKMYFKQTFTSVNNLINENIVYIDNVPVYTKDHGKRFIGIIKLNGNKKCRVGNSSLNLYNYNSIETVAHSNSSVDFIAFKNTKITYNTVVPQSVVANVYFRDIDRKTITVYTSRDTDYFNNNILTLQPGLYSLLLSSDQTQELLISTVLRT